MIELTSKRLKLRQWHKNDVAAYTELCSDLNVMQHLTGKAFNRLESWRHLAFLMGHWQINGFGQWAVEDLASGEFMGRIGFMQPEGWPGFEIGWVLAKRFWGNGFATEGARCALDYAFGQMGKTEVVSVIHPGNMASKKVAQRLGEQFLRHERLIGVEVEIWGMDKAQYLANAR